MVVIEIVALVVPLAMLLALDIKSDNEVHQMNTEPVGRMCQSVITGHQCASTLLIKSLEIVILVNYHYQRS